MSESESNNDTLVALFTQLNAKMDELKSELKSDISSLESRLDTRIASLERKSHSTSPVPSDDGKETAKENVKLEDDIVELEQKLVIDEDLLRGEINKKINKNSNDKTGDRRTTLFERSQKLQKEIREKNSKTFVIQAPAFDNMIGQKNFTPSGVMDFFEAVDVYEAKYGAHVHAAGSVSKYLLEFMAQNSGIDYYEIKSMDNILLYKLMRKLLAPTDAADFTCYVKSMCQFTLPGPVKLDNTDSLAILNARLVTYINRFRQVWDFLDCGQHHVLVPTFDNNPGGGIHTFFLGIPKTLGNNLKNAMKINRYTFSAKNILEFTTDISAQIKISLYDIIEKKKSLDRMLTNFSKDMEKVQESNLDHRPPRKFTPMPAAQKLHTVELEQNSNLDYDIDDSDQEDMWNMAAAQLADTQSTEIVSKDENNIAEQILALVQQYSKHPTPATNPKPTLPCYKFILNNGKCEEHDKGKCKYDHSPFACAKFFTEMAEKSNKIAATPRRLNSITEATNSGQSMNNQE
jgi:hypothetical protein